MHRRYVQVGLSELYIGFSDLVCITHSLWHGIYDEAEDSHEVQTRLKAGAADPTSDICFLIAIH